MRGKFLFLLLWLVFCFCALSILTQAEEQKDQLYWVFELVTSPSKAKEYEVAVKEEFAVYTESEFTHPWYAFCGNNFHYYFLSPLDNFATIDEIKNSYVKMAKTVGIERWQNVMKRVNEETEYVSMYIFCHRPDLSYAPEELALKLEEANFVAIDFFYIKPGLEREFEDVLKEYKSLDSRNNIPNSYSVSVLELGTDMPLYIGAAIGKKSSDLFLRWEEQREIYGKEGKILWEKTCALCRKFEVKTGWFRPDLSYIPKEK